MVTSTRETILRLAICSRATVLILSFVSNIILPDHNATDVFIYKNDDKLEDKGIFDAIIHILFGGLIRWDANYFIHISHYGYTKENVLAFFPLFPFTVRILASFFYFFTDRFLLYSSVLLLSSVVINFLLFIKCSLLLYDLSVKILKNDAITAYYAAIVFCVNPASIFFTAPYSETLFTFLTFSAIMHSLNNNFIVSSVIAGLSCSTRSNGILNVGFVVYNLIIFFIRNFSLSVHYIFSAIILLVACVLISLAPFCLFQLYAYVKFCLNANITSSSMNFNDVLIQSPWCNDTLPMAYSYVQNHYWNVGFLSYYQFKQIPNFLLALPIIYIILYNCCKKFKDEKWFFYTILIDTSTIFADIYNNKPSVINKLTYQVFIIHAFVLTIFCLLYVHVQISTRMLCSSSPVFYWFIADYFKKNYGKVCKSIRLSHNLTNAVNIKGNVENYLLVSEDKSIKDCWKLFSCDSDSCNYLVAQFFIKLYIINYFVFGTALFSNFYPWT